VWRVEMSIEARGGALVIGFREEEEIVTG